MVVVSGREGMAMAVTIFGFPHHTDLTGKDRMVRTPDSETRDSPTQPSSSKVKTVGGASYCQCSRQDGPVTNVRPTAEENTLADFAFDKLPTELLVEIFKHARPDNISDVYVKQYPTPLAQVCRCWRGVALDAPTLWPNIHIMKNYTEETKEAARINLERSKTAPLFLTWFSMEGQTNTEAQKVIDDLIIPYADRWQRTTLIANGDEVADALHAAMGPLNFQILQNLEISCLSSKLSPSAPTSCGNAPFLRRCRLHYASSLPPLSSNLVVFDYLLTMLVEEPFGLDAFLEFLPHVAHSLEHLRFGSPITGISAAPRELRIPLQNLNPYLSRIPTIFRNIYLPQA